MRRGSICWISGEDHTRSPFLHFRFNCSPRPTHTHTTKETILSYSSHHTPSHLPLASSWWRLTLALPGSEPIFEPATITNDAHSSEVNITVRDSSVALIPRTDAVRCIEARALAFQGRRRDVVLERLRTQRYVAPAGHYDHHFDWSVNWSGWGRVSSFMVWVDGSDDLVGGGTEFPLLERRGDWCDVAECAEPAGEGDGGAGGEGVVFKVKPGNAVFWENFAPDGRGYEEMWHAGLPVTEGTKVGLNIWSFGRIEG